MLTDGHSLRKFHSCLLINSLILIVALFNLCCLSSFGLNHLRKGGYGGWRSVFTVAMNEFFDEVYQYRMADSGLKFNFGPDVRGVDVFL